MFRQFWIAGFFLLAACSGPEPTATRGSLAVLATESIAPLLLIEGQEFQRQYENISISVAGTSTRDAIVQLLNDSVTAIAVDRSLNSEELAVAAATENVITTTIIGSDALVVIGHRTNKLSRLSLDALQAILEGRISNWRDVPGSGLTGTIDLVLTGRNSGLSELLSNHFFTLSAAPSVRTSEKTEMAIVNRVAGEASALGIVSFSTLNVARESNREFRSIRPLPIDTVSVSQQSIYSHSYALRYDVLFLTRERKSGPAAGFATFLSGITGQKIIQNSGIVPAKIPARTIELAQE
jgi:phosphate transport system substrate-binding protein